MGLAKGDILLIAAAAAVVRSFSFLSSHLSLVSVPSYWDVGPLFRSVSFLSRCSTSIDGSFSCVFLCPFGIFVVS